MTPLRRPRGPLPTRVYWVRRIVVLSVALVMVTSLAFALRLLSDGSAADGVRPAAGSQARPPAPATVTTTVTESPSAEPSASASASEEPVAQPTGTCQNTDVLVSPIVYRAEAGRPSAIVLELRTRDTAACYWQASSESLAAKITRPSAEPGELPLEIWDTRRCPQAVPTRNLILRRAESVRIAVRWSGHRADAECSRAARWALPGWYQVEVAALAGEPRQLLFELRKPSPVTVTQTPDVPSDEADADEGTTPDATSTDEAAPSDGADLPEERPTDEPLEDNQGVAEPDG